jgi:hypothetical protein
MKPYYEAPDEKTICPECGSGDVIEDKEHEVKSKENGKLRQFKYNSCNCVFIPAAVIGKPENKHTDAMEKWSKKVRMTEGNNNQSWRNYTDCIIIRKIEK